jgi:hypothetical protein
MNVITSPAIRRAIALLAALASIAVTAASATPAAATGNSTGAAPTLEHLDPGGTVDLALDVPITVVYVGLEEGAPPTGIDAEATVESMPVSARPNEEWQRAAGEPSEIGIEYRYDVEAVYADAAFEDALFAYLIDIGYELPPSPIQRYYSGNPKAAVEITDNLVLDATAVESWLIEHAPSMLDVDTTRPTVFFVNWWGRDDFRFHTYAPFTYQPEIDVFAPELVRNHGIAWGGGVPDAAQTPTSSLGRIWFVDVSAGPEWNTANFLLDIGDLTGDGYDDHRVPPIWEYGTDHWYEPFDDLSEDLWFLLRFVATNLLFTPGPLFDVGISAPLLDDELELDVNVFLEQAGATPKGGLDPDEMVRRFQALDPSRSFTTDMEVNPFTPALERAYDCASRQQLDPRVCQPGNQTNGEPFGTPLELGIWASDHDNEYLDGKRGEIPVAVLDVASSRNPRYIGFAFNQEWVFTIDSPLTRRSLTSPLHTTVHEVGHHLGVRHPHDGYDDEADVAYRASGYFWTVILGDETATQMSYLGSQIDFSQFDRDNLDRWLTAARLQTANDILGEVYQSPRASRAAADLQRADDLAGRAIDALHGWDLRDASVLSRDAYHAVLAAADAAGVHVEPHDATADVRSTGPYWTDDRQPDRGEGHSDIHNDQITGVEGLPQPSRRP